MGKLLLSTSYIATPDCERGTLMAEEEKDADAALSRVAAANRTGSFAAGAGTPQADASTVAEVLRHPEMPDDHGDAWRRRDATPGDECGNECTQAPLNYVSQNSTHLLRTFLECAPTHSDRVASSGAASGDAVPFLPDVSATAALKSVGGRPKRADPKCARCAAGRKKCGICCPDWPGHEQSTGGAQLDVGTNDAGDLAARNSLSPAATNVGTLVRCARIPVAHALSGPSQQPVLRLILLLICGPMLPG